MDSLFAVIPPTLPAVTDRTLLSIDDLRLAVGINNQTRDAELKALGLRVAERISRICGIRVDGAVPPTLRKESFTETFRVCDWPPRYSVELALSRRPITLVTSVTEDGATLATTDYEILAGKGSLRRLTSGTAKIWSARTTVVVYDAGWDTVPSDLKLAAEQLARAYWFQNSRDNAVRQVVIPGVSEKTYWKDSGADSDIPQNVMDMLVPYMTLAI